MLLPQTPHTGGLNYVYCPDLNRAVAWITIWGGALPRRRAPLLFTRPVVKCVSTVEKNGIFKNQSGGAGALFSPSLRAPVLLGHCYAALIPHCALEPPALPLPPFPAGGKTPTQEEPENPQHDCDKGATTPLLTHGLLRRLGDSACVSGPGCTRAAAPCAASRRRIRPRCERASA